MPAYRHPATRMRLYDGKSRRLYINQAERKRFLKVAKRQELEIKAFCLTLFYTGCRLSEGLALTASAVDTQSHLISFRTLKKRQIHEVREVPIPPVLVKTLKTLIRQRHIQNRFASADALKLWQQHGRPLNRITGYRWIKAVMEAADIQGTQASPKGLRHGFGVHAVRSGVQLNMLRKWMGHASIATTAIYANAVGKEEMEIAGRMWR